MEHIGVSGLGMLLSVKCPCRLSREDRGHLWIRHADNEMVTIAPGAAPATAEPARAPEARDPTWRAGADGPTLTMRIGDSLDAVITRVDVGFDDRPWSILAAGFWFDLAQGFVLHSPDGPASPHPELHLRDPSFRGPRTVPDAFISFEPRPVDAADARLTGPAAAGARELELEGLTGPVRLWDYGYQHDGAPWRKRHYAVALRPGVTLFVAAQAPAVHAALLFQHADMTAATIEPATMP